MSELTPGWAERHARESAETQPKRCFRVSQADFTRSRKRGSARGARSRFALKNLPPVDADAPLPEGEE